jgi:hypothetical protein
MKCKNGGGVIPKNGGKSRIYFGGRWVYRCSCGAVVETVGVGWAKGKHGLIVSEHDKAEGVRS